MCAGRRGGVSGPGQAVGIVASVDKRLDLEGFQINRGDGVVFVAGDIGDETVRADENFLRLGGHVDGLDDLEGLEINYGDLG